MAVLLIIPMWLDHGAQISVGEQRRGRAMVILDLGIDLEGALSMDADKAGHVNGTSKPNKVKVCVHQRMVDYHFNEKDQATGNVVCRECGAVIPDTAKVLG